MDDSLFPHVGVARLGEVFRNACRIFGMLECSVRVLGLHISVDIFDQEGDFQCFPLSEHLLCSIDRVLGQKSPDREEDVAGLGHYVI